MTAIPCFTNVLRNRHFKGVGESNSFSNYHGFKKKQFRAECSSVLIRQRVVHVTGRMDATLSGAGEETIALQPIEPLG